MRQRRMVFAGILLLAVVLVGCQTMGVTRLGGLASRMVQPERGADVVRVEGARGSDVAGLEEHRIEVGGLTRTYHLYVPPGLGDGAMPLVVAFHGGGGNALPFANRAGLREMADANGFVLALPEGLRESWNTGSINPQGYAEEAGIDDLAFVARMLDDIASRQAVDNDRIFAMGMSRGGMMSYLVGCEMPGRFAAVAAVSATLSSGVCPMPGGTSLLHIHGSADERVPFEGGQGEFTPRGQTWTSAREGIAIFAAANQCSQARESRQVAPDTICQQIGCSGSTRVEYCLVEGGGHVWPGARTTQRQQLQGANSSPYFNATDYIAQFFLVR